MSMYIKSKGTDHSACCICMDSRKNGHSSLYINITKQPLAQLQLVVFLSKNQPVMDKWEKMFEPLQRISPLTLIIIG